MGAGEVVPVSFIGSIYMFHSLTRLLSSKT